MLQNLCKLKMIRVETQKDFFSAHVYNTFSPKNFREKMEILPHLYALGRATNRNPNTNPNPKPGASDISSHVANMSFFFLKRNFIEKG